MYASGVTLRGPYKDGPGEVNVSVAIAGMVIEPGDLIIGDEDGLLCVPFAELDTIYAKAKAKSDAEHAQLEAIAGGAATGVGCLRRCMRATAPFPLPKVR